ncbi:MAG: hypothetical protein H0X01_05490 [Nitrospira sp.]|nr:hypothetical protein [Nitrospira sp.]
MALIGQREQMIRVQDVSGEWLSRHVLEVLSQRELIRASITTRYAEFATIYEAELTRLLGLFNGAGGPPQSRNHNGMPPRAS